MPQGLPQLLFIHCGLFKEIQEGVEGYKDHPLIKYGKLSLNPA
jgi:hypothetical protein